MDKFLFVYQWNNWGIDGQEEEKEEEVLVEVEEVEKGKEDANWTIGKKFISYPICYIYI